MELLFLYVSYALCAWFHLILTATLFFFFLTTEEKQVIERLCDWIMVKTYICLVTRIYILDHQAIIV